jgi:nickel-dependent lactate racemase
VKPDKYGQRLAHPFATAPLRELANGNKEVVIIFDDMSGIPARRYPVLPLKEIEKWT